MSDPRWLTEAAKHIGTKEVPGLKHEPKILQWWKAIKRGGIKTDEVPWCAAFVGAMLEETGIVSSRYESAASYLNWGVPLPQAMRGCVVVFTRKGGGHVGFVMGKDAAGNLLVLGGNQSDTVSIRAFPLARVAGYRWPEPGPALLASLPVLGAAELSTSEA